MNQLESLGRSVEREFPDAEVSIDAPATETGTWWLDVNLDGLEALIEWRKGRGFGLTVGAVDPMDSGSHEMYASMELVKARLYDCLRTGTETVPVARGALKELRVHAGLSQEELAKRLGVSQAAVSQMESGEDIQITTLRKVVKALGGELSVVARFPSREFEIDTPSTSTNVRTQRRT